MDEETEIAHRAGEGIGGKGEKGREGKVRREG